MASTKTSIQIDGKDLQLSNLDKVMFPATGFTKGQVIDYYIRISSVLLPHLNNRPLTMKRYPDGIHGAHFYEKDAPSHTPKWIKTAPVERRSDGTTIRYVLLNDLPSLVWSANLANLEIHTILARAPKIDQPTMVVFDLDPGEPANFIQCAEVAFLLKEILDRMKLDSFAKSSGSKGIQVYIPLNTPVDYETTAGFAKAIADYLHQQHPKLVVSEMAKKLRVGKVFIDWSQNSRHKTTVGVYSIRAKHEQPYVSTPFTWEEMNKLLKKGDPEGFLLDTDEVLRRVEKNGDIFEPVQTLKQKIPAKYIDALNSSKPAAKSSSKAKDTSIKTYNEKRDFTRTQEPKGKVEERKAGSKKRMYVIQKHIASHLHYDFRLEMQGVLRSWAVPKGVPTQKGERKLAMHVEDHPMEYAKFEGTIPKGNYGAGTVMVWDIGTYTTMEENPVAAYHAGKLHLYMEGKKLKGEWVLVRTGRDDPRQWLLMKAGAKMAPFSTKKDDQSALTGRTMKQIAADNDAQWISNRPPAEGKSKRKFAQRIQDPIAKFSSVLNGLPSGKPLYVEPMQSKPVTSLPDGNAWIYEIKFDGYRALGIRQGNKIRLASRSNKDLSRQYPEIVESLKSLPEKDWVVDGEIVALDEKGVPSFQLLQNIGSAKEDRPLHYFSFDLIHLDGKDLKGIPLFQRKQILEALLESSDGRILFSANIQGDPEVLIKEAHKRGLEGIVAKRKESKYEPGKRSGLWQKFKTEAEQEFVIGGYKPSSRSNSLDSILAGYYVGKKLMYAGSVRAGFTPRTRTQVYSLIQDLVISKCPFANLPEEEKGRWGEGLTEEDMAKCIWIKPKVVVRIEFAEWTSSNHLRHAKFKGIVEDKKAKDVVKES